MDFGPEGSEANSGVGCGGCICFLFCIEVVPAELGADDEFIRALLSCGPETGKK